MKLDVYRKDAINVKYRVRTLRSSRGNVKKRKRFECWPYPISDVHPREYLRQRAPLLSLYY